VHSAPGHYYPFAVAWHKPSILPLYARARIFFATLAHETAGALRHPDIFCVPLVDRAAPPGLKGETWQRLERLGPRDREDVSSTVFAVGLTNRQMALQRRTTAVAVPAACGGQR
jgi:hypothetical protein